MSKAQASVELLIILAVSIVAIGLILALSNNEIINVNSIKANSDAQNTVNKIAGAAEDVYVSGTGTSKQIFISIPSGVDETKTSVGNKTIRLNVNGTDLIAETKVEVTGSIPTETGGHWIWITSYSGYVLIGDVRVETDKGSIYSTIAQDSTAIEHISIINNTSDNATVNVNVNWSNPEVTLSLSENSFVVPSASSYGINLTFTSSASAVGNYSGEIIFDVTTVEGTKQLIVPITLEVITGGSSQPLMVFPDFWNPVIDAGNSDSADFQLCNTTDSALTSINFTFSAGDAGNWIQPIPSLLSLNAKTCSQITVTINVPLGASSETGTVTASDGINSAVISLNVTVNAVPIIIAFEEFPSNNWNTGFGWNTAWTHSEDTSIVTTGGMHSSPRHLRLRRNTGYAERAVDLTGYSNIKLEFWAKTNGFEAGEEAYALVSPDGLTWFTLKTFVDGEDDNTYKLYEYDLDSFGLTNNFLIAFDAEMNATNDYFYIDDITITGTP